MKHKQSDESQKFDKMMDGLLAVPYSELKKKLEEEKEHKKEKKKPVKTSSSGRVSLGETEC